VVLAHFDECVGKERLINDTPSAAPAVFAKLGGIERTASASSDISVVDFLDGSNNMVGAIAALLLVVYFVAQGAVYGHLKLPRRRGRWSASRSSSIWPRLWRQFE
jgi:hypothetical protein